METVSLTDRHTNIIAYMLRGHVKYTKFHQFIIDNN